MKNYRNLHSNLTFKSVVLILLLTPLLSHMTLADENAKDNLDKLKNADPKIVSTALNEASQFQYEETFSTVLGILESEVKKHGSQSQRVNTYILSAGFQALLSLTGEENRDRVKSLIEVIQSSSILPFSNTQTSKSFKDLKDKYQSSNTSLEKLFNDSIEVLRKEFDKLGSTGDVVISGSVEFIRDQSLALKERGDFIPVEGRDSEARITLETLAELTTSIALLTGPAGAGKSSIAKLIDEWLANDLIPKTEAMKSFHGGYVIETTPARISSLAKSNDDNAQAAALELYLDSVIKAQKELGKKIIIFIDEVHTLSDSQVEAIKRYTGGQSEINFIFASTSEEFNIKFKQNEAFLRRVGQVPVEELSFEKIKNILSKTWIPKIEEIFSVKFDEKVIDRVINESTKLLPHGGKIDGSIKLLNKLAVKSSPLEGEEVVDISKQELSNLIKEYYSLPIDPNNYAQTLVFFEDLELKINDVVLDQERMVKDVLSVYKNLLQSRSDNVKSVYVMGPTGVGKTYFGQVLADLVLSNSKALYEMNGNDLMEGGLSLNSEFGAPNGVASSDKTPGEFMAWLDDQARGGRGGILVLNEIDKAHPDVLKKIMELLDRGFVVGNDGKKRSARNLLVIMTSNKSMDMVFPKGGRNLSKEELTKLADSLNSDGLKDMIDYSATGNDDGKMLPEIKNRIDLFTLALPFIKETSTKVARKLINESIEYFKNEHEVIITVDDSLIQIIVDSSYNPLFGARPTIRTAKTTFQEMVNHAARVGKIEEGEKILFRHDVFLNEFQVLDEKNNIVANYPAPKVKSVDPLEDKALVETLLSLEDLLSGKIYGQEEMISNLALAVTSHLGSPVEKDKALSLFLIGSTATGKTETAKALAEALFKSRQRTGILNLGNVRFEGDFNTVFNPPKGYVSGDQAGEFEQFLNSNPEGGVLLFDEASNMGSGSKAQKNALFKLLYQITDEPSWTSSATGKTYDLTKYIFLFTGNDGDKLFQGIGSDDLRKSNWQNNKDKSRVMSLLREAGLPEPFLGRMADLFLMSPLTREIVSDKIVPKFLKKTTDGLNLINLNYSFEENFNSKLGEIFFTQDSGGRSVKNLIDSKLEGAITDIRLNLIREGVDLSTIKLEISLEDNQPNVVYVDEKNSTRLVNLRVKVTDLNGVVIRERDFDLTADSDKSHLMTKDDALLTAYHEAGHAVANDPVFTNQNLAFITIKGRGSYLGYARYENGIGQTTLSEQNGMYKLAALLAGSAAQQLAGFSADTGMNNDIKQAKDLINQLISSGIYPELIHSTRFSDNGSVVFMDEKARTKADELFKQAWELSVNLVVQNWTAVEGIKDQLMKDGEVSGDKVNTIINESGELMRPSNDKISEVKNFTSKIENSVNKNLSSLSCRAIL